jgi:hypothetical protein
MLDLKGTVECPVVRSHSPASVSNTCLFFYDTMVSPN